MDDIRPGDVLPVLQFPKEHPHLGSIHSLRWQIFNAELNGLSKSGAIVRRGRRVFVVVPRYMAWLAGQQKQAA